jgi:hypothetical protein
VSGAAGGTKSISNIDERVLGGLDTGYPAIWDIERVHVPRVAGIKCTVVAVINGGVRIIDIVDNLNRFAKRLDCRR